MPRAKAVAAFAVLLLTTGFGVCTAEDSHVEPLVQKYCIGCHSNSEDGEGGVSLASTAAIAEGADGQAIFDSRNPKASRLFKVLATDGDTRMPPADEPQPTAAEREILKQWVLDGATLQAARMLGTSLPTITPVHRKNVPLLASEFVPSAGQVVVVDSQSVSLLDYQRQTQTWQTDSDIGKLSGLSLAHRNPWVVVSGGFPGADGATVFVSTEDGSLLKTFRGHADVVYAGVLNADDSILATAGYDRRIQLHSVETGEIQKTLQGHNGAVFDLAFSPNGKILCSASADGTVKVWQVESGQRLDTLSQPQGEQYAVLVSPDGQQIYAAGADNRIRVWQLVSVDRPQINPLLTSQFAHEQAITTLALNQQGSLLASAAEDGTLQVWQTTPLRHHQTLETQTSLVTSACFISDQQLFITRMDGTWSVIAVQPVDGAAPESPSAADAVTALVMLDASDVQQLQEQEPNNSPDGAQAVTVPSNISGVIDGQQGDSDVFAFSAKQGEQLLLEVKAQRDQSPLDSYIEVLDAAGKRIVQTRLQAVRDSYFTFRGKDSDTSDDFRVFNWQEMELNEYLYADGEVVRLWLYPRGPDSGFKVYPGRGNRYTYFGTTATAHALQAPCYIVIPRHPDEHLVHNGLPVFPVYYENDDDPLREWGGDSRLSFTAPEEGRYVVRITDARGFSGADYKYSLTVRHPRPGFSVSYGGNKLKVVPGTGRELSFNARRIDGYEGPITVSVENLPEGFGASGPTTIEQDQLQAFITVFAKDGASNPTAEQVAGIRVVARAVINEQEVVQTLPGIEELSIVEEAKLLASIRPDSEQPDAAADGGTVIEINPGETVRAFVHLDRVNFNGVVSFGKEDSGRNLPHGVFVDNIGLNGLLIPADQTDREFFITAAKWVPEMTRTFYLRADTDGGTTTLPVTLKVLGSQRQNPDTVAEVRSVPIQ
jgi:hypothetical protein